MNNKNLKKLAELKDDTDVSIERILEALGKDAEPIICLLCVLPFLQPLPLPGASFILGTIILIQGIGLTGRNKVHIFKKLTGLKLNSSKMAFIYSGAIKLNWFTTKFSAHKHPVVSSKWSYYLSGMAIISSAIFLLLPLPLPMSDFLPSISILLISIGLLEDDLILISLGYGLTSVLISLVIFSYNIIFEQLLSSF